MRLRYLVVASNDARLQREVQSLRKLWKAYDAGAKSPQKAVRRQWTLARSLVGNAIWLCQSVSEELFDQEESSRFTLALKVAKLAGLAARKVVGDTNLASKLFSLARKVQPRAMQAEDLAVEFLRQMQEIAKGKAPASVTILPGSN